MRDRDLFVHPVPIQLSGARRTAAGKNRASSKSPTPHPALAFRRFPSLRAGP
jgi:hypothetical protein